VAAYITLALGADTGGGKYQGEEKERANMGDKNKICIFTKLRHVCG